TWSGKHGGVVGAMGGDGVMGIATGLGGRPVAKSSRESETLVRIGSKFSCQWFSSELSSRMMGMSGTSGEGRNRRPSTALTGRESPDIPAPLSREELVFGDGPSHY